MPTYSLWRGGTLLGHFEERLPVTHHGNRVSSEGILTPTEAFAGTSPMMQTRLEILPGRPVFQHPVEPIVLGVAPPPKTGDGPKAVALEPLSEEAAKGVPTDLMFLIRDESGKIIETDMVVLQLLSIPPGIEPSSVYEANGLVGNSRDIWEVSFSISVPPPNGQL